MQSHQMPAKGALDPQMDVNIATIHLLYDTTQTSKNYPIEMSSNTIC